MFYNRCSYCIHLFNLLLIIKFYHCLIVYMIFYILLVPLILQLSNIDKNDNINIYI